MLCLQAQIFNTLLICHYGWIEESVSVREKTRTRLMGHSEPCVCLFVLPSLLVPGLCGKHLFYFILSLLTGQKLRPLSLILTLLSKTISIAKIAFILLTTEPESEATCLRLMQNTHVSPTEAAKQVTISAIII